MSDNRINLSFENKEIILIGTAHISKESIEEVRTVITDEKPVMVCVELDHGRYNSIVKKDSWEKLDIVKMLKEGKGFFLIANLVLGSFQKRLGAELGVKPGEEMKCAVETAQSIGVPFSFCDRDIQITLRRAWAKCGFISKCKLLAALLSSAFTTEKLDETQIEDLKKNSELDGMMAELAAFMPEVKAVLIDERDCYLASKIWDSACNAGINNPDVPAARSPDSGERFIVKKTVAVVGAGHLHGLAAHLKKIADGSVKSDVSEIEVLPPKGIGGKIAAWIIPVLIVGLVAAGFLVSGKDLGLDALLRWVLWNGSLAALGTIIALGHPLVILSAFVAAPIGTLNPFLSVGVFTGILQALLYKPQVADAENLVEAVTSIKGVYKNRITHPLLIFFLSSIGGAVGNFISIPNIAGLFLR
ncbi:MAG: TraB/GumN family protein [Termitinemataceae bacterium]|nr:MAG: TraB/GumN family protein [Termitinemataceae bacterium]